MGKILMAVVMAGGLWLALPDTPDKDIGLSYFGVVSHPHSCFGNWASARVARLTRDSYGPWSRCFQSTLHSFKSAAAPFSMPVSLSSFPLRGRNDS